MLRRGPQEIYRVYAEDELPESDEWNRGPDPALDEIDAHPPLQRHARPLPRFAAAALLTIVVGTLAMLTAEALRAGLMGGGRGERSHSVSGSLSTSGGAMRSTAEGRGGRSHSVSGSLAMSGGAMRSTAEGRGGRSHSASGSLAMSGGAMRPTAVVGGRRTSAPASAGQASASAGQTLAPAPAGQTSAPIEQTAAPASAGEISPVVAEFDFER
jgi:hypothetical protein